MLNYLDELSKRKTGQKLTNHAKNTLIEAINLARKENSHETTNIHLFRAIYAEKGSMGSAILKDLGVRKEHFGLSVKKKLSSDLSPSKIALVSSQLRKTLARAFTIAKNLNYSYVGTEHLTYSLLDSSDRNIKRIIARTNPSKKKKKTIVSPNSLDKKSPLHSLKDFLAGFPEFQAFSDVSPEITLTKDPTARTSPTPYLDKFCVDLNKVVAKRKETIIGRDKEVGRIINILGRKSKNNPLLIGYPGVGKTALVMKLAELINQGEVPAFLFEKRLMSLDIAALIAGTSFRGEFEMRLKEIIKETSASKEIILFIDEIHNIVGAGNIAGNLDLANIIKPALSQGEIHLIGATTFKEFKQHIEKDAALERRFQPVTIKEPRPEEAREILLGIKKDYEDFHNVSITEEAINLSLELSCRYIQERFLPDKAIDVLDEAASHVRSKEKISDFNRKIKELKDEKNRLSQEKEKKIIQEKYEEAMAIRSKEKELEERIKFLEEEQKNMEQKKRIEIDARDVVETVAKISGIPEEKLARIKSQKIRDIHQVLKKKIVGQDEAVKKLANVITRSQLGISHPERPLGSFLFLGPSGVGKTMAAKTLAAEFFSSEKSLIRFDMSEFMERHSGSALIGSPAGYVGYGEGGRLTEKVRRNPYSVVLFDEIEKSHPDIFNILLQILEEGVLTDAQGLEVSFKNTIIILTTNIGTEEFNSISPAPLGFSLQNKKNTLSISPEKNEIETRVLRELEEKMRPELLNRLDHILVFNPLTAEDMKKIADLELDVLKKRMEKQGINLTFHEKVSDFLAQKSFAKDQGARFIRKNIQEFIENEIARMMVEDKIKNGKINISVKNKKLILK